MTFFEAIASYFRNFANFKGRSRRSEYWFAYLFYVIVAVPVSLTSYSIDPYTGSVVYGPLYYVWVLGNLIPGLAVATRRLHDIGKSGWFILIPIYNIVLLATDTVPTANAYGEPAK